MPAVLRSTALLPWLLAAVAAKSPRVCRVVAGEDCRDLWADFDPTVAAATPPAVVILTFEGDGYYAGARATIASAVGKAQGKLLFAVASSSHAGAIADWFSGLTFAAASGHALCSVDPQSLPDVWGRAQELAGYSKPEHHSNWGTAAPSALYRVFLRQLFPHAVRALYVDADVILQADPAAIAAEVVKPFAQPLAAARSANMLKMRMDYCCQASKKVGKLLANSSQLDAQDAELLQEFQDLTASYREFNNGVMALDLVKLEEAGVFKRLELWLRLNVKHGLFNNDQHAWNLAATLHWQDLQESFATNAPSLELMEASLREPSPVEHYKAYLRSLSIVHYTNQPKPWQVDWTKVPKGSLLDDGIWIKAFQYGGGGEEERQQITLSVREVAGRSGLIFMRPASTAVEDFEYGMMYMEGSGGFGADTSEARWRLTRAAAGGDAQAQFMISHGLEEELRLPDKTKLEKLERCWTFAGQRIEGNEDHQTLRGLYKMSELEYLAKKAPVMVPSCYWRLKVNKPHSKQLSPKELEELFGSGDNAQSVPGLTPRLSKWLELVTKDKLNDAGKGPAGEVSEKDRPPPVVLRGWYLLPALGLLGLAVGVPVWKLLGSKDQKGGKKKKKKNA